MDSDLLVEIGRMSDFLTARLTEDLARIWERDAACVDPHRRPGMAAQVQVLDDLLTVLAAGRLPERRELRLLLYGYGHHRDYEPGWTGLLDG
jgi:hypothetical protein